MSFVSTDPPNHKGKTDIWLTPLDWLSKLGNFDLDPCAFFGHNTAEKLIYPPSDGLKSKWHGRVFLNPPYSDVEAWLDAAFDKYSKKEIDSCVALLFARTDTRWAQRHLRLWDSVLFLSGRIRFLRSDDLSSGSNAGTPSMVLFLGEDPSTYPNGVKL